MSTKAKLNFVKHHLIYGLILPLMIIKPPAGLILYNSIEALKLLKGISNGLLFLR